MICRRALGHLRVVVDEACVLLADRLHAPGLVPDAAADDRPDNEDDQDDLVNYLRLDPELFDHRSAAFSIFAVEALSFGAALRPIIG